MKKILMSVVVLCTLSSSIRADHPVAGNIAGLARQLVSVTYSLESAAQQMVGYYASPRQRYALEHLRFFTSSARRFEQVACGYGVDYYRLRQQFGRLEQDAYHARQTLGDLYYGDRDDIRRRDLDRNDRPFIVDVGGNADDHPGSGGAGLERLMAEAEQLLSYIGRSL